jgi:hypothetical protein
MGHPLGDGIDHEISELSDLATLTQHRFVELETHASR